MILLLTILFLDHSWVRVNYELGLNNFAVMEVMQHPCFQGCIV